MLFKCPVLTGQSS